MQATISDASGQTVMSALLSGPAATTPNLLLDWSCTQYDLVYTLAGVGDVKKVKQIDTDGNAVSSLSDGYGWGVGSLDQGSNLTQTGFNPGGQPLTVTNALSNDTTYVYDSLGRPTSMTTPAATTTAVYSATTGQLTSRADGKSKSTSFQYDALGRLSITTDRLNKQSSRSYFRTGQLASITDAESRTTSYDYDVMGRRTELTMPAINGGTAQETTYTYDSAGRAKQVALHSGAKRKIVYEFSGVVDKVDYFAPSSSTPSGTDDFTYDAFLRRTASSSDDDVNHAYTYTDRGQLNTDTTSYSSQDYVVDYDYDSRGRLSRVTYPSGREVDYAFTNRSELDTIDWDGTEIENRAYDTLGRMTSVDRAYVDETRVYDNANRVTSIANTNLGTAAYTYDANSNKLGETWTGVLSNWSFTTEDSGTSDPDGYDDEDRFVRFEQSGQSKDYDLVRSDIGNITNRKLNGASQLRTFNEVYQLDDLAGTSQVFDANGSLTTSHTGMTLSWQDGNGRLAQTIVPSGATAGIEGTNDYGYDADNNRLWKKITRSGSIAEHTVYIYAGPNCIAEYDAGAAATSPGQEYVYGQGIDSLLMIAHDNNSERLTVLRNQQWSISGLTKASDGSIAELYSYDVFGNRTILEANGATVRTSSSYNNPYGHTSRRHDDESGLIYYRARYYDPDNGEFVTQDPLEYVDGASLYRGYFGLNGVDPLGKECTVCGSGVRYRVDIASLDAFQVDTPYQDGADTWQQNLQGSPFAKTWHLTFPKFTKAGPTRILNPAFDVPDPPVSMEAGTMAVAMFLFFVDFEVGNPEDCVIEVFETRGRRVWTADKNEWTEIMPDATEKKVAEAPAWKGNLALSERKKPVGCCTHTIVMTDLPTADSILKPAFDGKLPVMYKQNYANQRVVVTDKATKVVKAQISHDFMIGHDSTGNLVYSP